MSIKSDLVFREKAIALEHLVRRAHEMGLSIESFRELDNRERLNVLSELGAGIEKLSRALTKFLQFKNKLIAQGKDVNDLVDSIKNHKLYIEEVFNKCLEPNS